jgi:hypothetical protein
LSSDQDLDGIGKNIHAKYTNHLVLGEYYIQIERDSGNTLQTIDFACVRFINL